VIGAGVTSKAELDSSGVTMSELGIVSVTAIYLQRSPSYLPGPLIASHTTDPEGPASAFISSALAFRFLMFFMFRGMFLIQINEEWNKRAKAIERERESVMYLKEGSRWEKWILRVFIPISREAAYWWIVDDTYDMQQKALIIFATLDMQQTGCPKLFISGIGVFSEPL
jgi:hypothetical protein